MAYDLSDLDLAYLTRERVEAELMALAYEQRKCGREIVQGVRYQTTTAADIKRGDITERCMNDLDRLDETIARLSLSDDVEPSHPIYDDDDKTEVGRYYDEWPEDAGGYDPDGVIDDDWTPNPHTRSEAA